MIEGVTKDDKGNVTGLIIGLSRSDIDEAIAKGSCFYQLNEDKLNLPFPVVIYFGETSAAIIAAIKLGPDVEKKITIDPNVNLTKEGFIVE